MGWFVWTQYELSASAVPHGDSASGPLTYTEPVTTAPGVAAPPNVEQGLYELAEGGDPRAQYLLGRAYLTGEGTTNDPTLAVKWFERAAQQGNADAQHALGLIYLTGRGALQHFEAAFEWFEKAAMQNHAEAQYRLGTMLRDGDGVAEDKVKAYVWFNLAAAQGHERAAEARDRLRSALTTEQVVAAQRASHEWRPVTAKKETPLGRPHATGTQTPVR